MVIFPHIPKTGGTTLKAAMAHAFGERLLLDYDDRPLAHHALVRNAAALLASRKSPDPDAWHCVYGHFMPLKYSRVAGAVFVTWLRDPVQRMLSRYHHYTRASLSGEAALPAGLTLEQFCRIPRFQDTYRKYLWRFPLERFDFIGLTERFDDSLDVLSSRYGIDCAERGTLNANPDRGVEPYVKPYDVEPAMARAILEANAGDAAIYQQALRRFPARPGPG